MTAREKALSKRSRIPVVSNLVDCIYGCLPAPFFVYNGQVAPSLMMNRIPGSALVVLSVGMFVGLVYQANELLGFNFGVSAFIPVFVHWFLFFFHAVPNQSEKLFDLAGQIAFHAMAIFSFSIAMKRKNGPHPRQVFTTILALLWSFRLGWFLFSRFLERRSDFRFIEARKKHGYHMFAWTSQGVWCFIQGLPLLLLNLVEKTNDNHPGEPLNRIDRLGWMLLLTGLAIETVADKQKLAFQRSYPKRSSRPFIQQGLWSLSRHPNYCVSMRPYSFYFQLKS